MYKSFRDDLQRRRFERNVEDMIRTSRPGRLG